MRFSSGLLSVLTVRKLSTVRLLEILLTGLWIVTATVSGQSTTAYTDPSNGIQFQRVSIESNGGFHFGIAFPQNQTSSSEFIGQIKGPVNTGYSGISLGGGMVGRLLLVSWAQGSNIHYSFRMAEYVTATLLNISSSTNG